MEQQFELNDPLYKNWIKVGLGLKYANDMLHTFISNSIAQFRCVVLSGNSTTTCNQCTLLNILPCCATNFFCSFNADGCKLHNNLDNSKTFRPCPNNVCDKLQQAIAHEHISRRGPNWTGSDPKQWCSNVWEIAKCFMPYGNENKHDYSEFDFSGIISMIMNAKFIQGDLPVTYDAEAYKKVYILEIIYKR